jgi:glycosyltransferase involved in cell wall biosynthesis
VSAVPELVVDGETGSLVPPDDPAALAAALLRLIREPVLRHACGAAGAARVRAQFDGAVWLDRLAARFQTPRLHSAGAGAKAA